MARAAVILAGLMFALPLVARAELPTVRFMRLTPMGANAGTEVEIIVGGAEFDTVDTLLFDQPGLSAKMVGQNRFRVAVAADVPAGTYDVWAVGKYGISNPKLFAVSHGLVDVAVKKPNQTPEKAQEIAVNSAVNGQTDAAGEFFRFQAKQGQRITFDCLCQRLVVLDTRGITAEIVLTLLSTDGRILARNSHYYGNDPFIDHTFAEDGSYLLQVEELRYVGGKPYRLVVSDRPHIENVSPRVIEPGKAVELTVFGRNLGVGAKLSPWTVGTTPLEEKPLLFTLPATVATGAFSFLEHPTGFAYPVTCSAVRTHGMQVRPDWEGGALNAFSVLSAWTQPTLEAEPNDDLKQAQRITTTVLVDARFDKPGDVDWYTFTVPPGAEGKYTLQIYCERIGGRADPYVLLEDEKGGGQTELDDQRFGGQMGEGRNRDPFGLIDLVANRTYRIMVKDLHGRGGARCQYVLSCRKAETDFYAMSWAPVITFGGVGNCRGTTIRRGGSEFVPVSAIHEGVPCPVTIEAENLPPGLHAAPCSLSSAPTATGAVVLYADRDMPEWTGPIQLTAVAAINGQTIRRPVVPVTASGTFDGGRSTRTLMAAVRYDAPFSLRATPDKITVAPGSQIPLKFNVVRLTPECKGRIEILNTNYSTLNVTFANQVIAAGETEVSCKLEVSKQAVPGNYTICFNGVTTVSVVRDSAGGNKPEEFTAFEPCVPLAITVKLDK